MLKMPFLAVLPTEGRVKHVYLEVQHLPLEAEVGALQVEVVARLAAVAALLICCEPSESCELPPTQ